MKLRPLSPSRRGKVDVDLFAGAEALVRAALRLRRRPEPIASPQLRLWQAAA